MLATPHLELPNIFVSRGLNCRQYTAEDCLRVVEIVNHAFAYQDEAKGSPRTDAEQIEKYANKYDMYVFTKGAEIVGCVYTNRKKNILHFGLLVLTDEYRGTGVGAVIIKSIIELAKSSYCTEVELDYLSLASWLKTYYEKFGFTETGVREKWLDMEMIQMHKQLV